MAAVDATSISFPLRRARPPAPPLSPRPSPLPAAIAKSSTAPPASSFASASTTAGRRFTAFLRKRRSTHTRAAAHPALLAPLMPSPPPPPPPPPHISTPYNVQHTASLTTAFYARSKERQRADPDSDAARLMSRTWVQHAGKVESKRWRHRSPPPGRGLVSLASSAAPMSSASSASSASGRSEWPRRPSPPARPAAPRVSHIPKFHKLSHIRTASEPSLSQPPPSLLLSPQPWPKATRPLSPPPPPPPPTTPPLTAASSLWSVGGSEHSDDDDDDSHDDDDDSHGDAYGSLLDAYLAGFDDAPAPPSRNDSLAGAPDAFYPDPPCDTAGYRARLSSRLSLDAFGVRPRAPSSPRAPTHAFGEQIRAAAAGMRARRQPL